jgi:hypothetical protein
VSESSPHPREEGTDRLPWRLYRAKTSKTLRQRWHLRQRHGLKAIEHHFDSYRQVTRFMNRFLKGD